MDPEFKTCYERWSECLLAKDRNSVFQQVASMTWDAAVYEVINEARLLAPAAPEGGVQLNGMMHRFIDHLFFESQMTAIRRLSAKEDLKGNRGTYGLRALIEDMAVNRRLLTRRNLCEVTRTPLSLTLLQEREAEYRRSQVLAGKKCFHIPTDLDCSLHERRHQDIDWLCHVDPQRRSPDDRVRDEVFVLLRQNLACCEHVISYVNKYVAHAATQLSRRVDNSEMIKLTRARLRQAHEAICRATDIVCRYLVDGTSFHPLPLDGDDRFDYIERPIACKRDVATLEKVWNRYRSMTDRWCEDNTSWLYGKTPDLNDA